MFVCVFMRYFMTSTVVSRLVLCETWLRTKSRLIKRVCVLELEADRGSGDRLVCVFAVRSENELNDPQPTQLLTSVCGGKPVSPARTPASRRFFIALLSAFISELYVKLGRKPIGTRSPASFVYLLYLACALLYLTASPFSQLPLPLPLLSLPLTC